MKENMTTEEVEEMKAFLKKYLTCALPDPIESPILHDLVKTYQVAFLGHGTKCE